MVSNENPEPVTGIKEDDDAEYLHRTSPDRVEHYSKMNRPDGTGASWIEEEYNQLDEVNSMTLEKIEADKESFPRDQWELFNMNMDGVDVQDSDEEFEKLYEQLMKEGKTLLK